MIRIWFAVETMVALGAGEQVYVAGSPAEMGKMEIFETSYYGGSEMGGFFRFMAYICHQTPAHSGKYVNIVPMERDAGADEKVLRAPIYP